MKETNEINPEESNEQLSVLKESLIKALDEGDMQKAGKLKAEIKPHLKVLQGEYATSFKDAREVMGEDFLGPEEVEKVFGIHVEKKDIPEVQFTRKDLERARELGQFLVLRVNETKEGEPLSIKEMGARTKVDIVGDREILTDDVTVENVPQAGWALVTKKLVPLSKNREYFEQVGALAQYLHAQVFKDKTVPEVYQEALNEYAKENLAITRAINSMQTDALYDITELQITKLLMPTASEAIYDMLMYTSSRNEPNMFGASGNTHSVTTRDTVFQKTGAVEVALDSGSILVRYGSVQQQSDPTTGTLFARKI